MHFPDKIPTGALFTECANGNKDAETCISTLYSYIDWLDDIVDQDVAHGLEQSVKMSLNAFLMLSFNPFWNQHKEKLAGCLIAGFNAWIDSEFLKQHKDYRFRVAADVLKGYFMEFFYQVAFITGGYDFMRAISKKWRGVDFDAIPDTTKPCVQNTVAHAWSFPLDHGIHDQYNGEWWYFSGNLYTDSDKEIGYHYAQFRIMGQYHTHISIFKDGKVTFKYEFYHDDNRVQIAEDGYVRLDNFKGDDYLELQIGNEVKLHGKNFDGYSPKSKKKDHYTHYYSALNVRTIGRIEGEDVTGASWFDHEFGNFQEKPNFHWIFFYGHLNNGDVYHAYLIFDKGELDHIHSQITQFRKDSADRLTVFSIKGNPSITNPNFSMLTGAGTIEVKCDSSEVPPPLMKTALKTYLELPCTITLNGQESGKGYLEIT